MEKRQLCSTAQALALHRDRDDVVDGDRSSWKGSVTFMNASAQKTLISLVVGLLLADPARATTIRAKYTISYLGLPVGDMETVKTFGASTYRTGVDARVTGIATIVSNFKMNMKSNGIIRKNVVQPNNFAAEETGSGEIQTMRLTLVGGSVKSAEVVPPIKDLDQRVPLQDEHKKDIVDPASTLIMTVPSGQDPLGPSACKPHFSHVRRLLPIRHRTGFRQDGRRQHERI